MMENNREAILAADADDAETRQPFRAATPKAGWPNKKISEIATHSLGKMLDKARNTGEFHPYLRNLNVRWFDFDLSDVLEMRFRPEEKARYTIIKGDLVICEGGYPGRAAIWDKEEPIHFQKALHRVRFNEPERAKWCLYYLQFRDLSGTLKQHFNGAGIQHFTGEALAKFTLPIPPLPEQRRIVGILDEAFAGLEAMRVHAEKNLQNARTLFDTELEDIFTNTLAHSPRKTLAEIALEIGRGKSRHRPRGDPKLLGGRHPFIQTGEVANAIHVIESYSQTYNELGLAQSKLWPKDTVCIAIVGANVAETAILGFEACFPDSVIGFIANPKHADVDYVQYLLRAFKSVLKEKGKGTARDNINMSTFESERFPMPSLSEQSRIALRLKSLSGETQLLEDVYLRKLAAIDELKKSLLHNAFSGNL